MAGDTDNTSVWSEADVYIGSLTAPNPAGNAAFTLNTTSRTASVTTTNASTAITAATATFVASDVGKSITGTGIPAGATITAVSSATAATISAAATASGTVTATIGTTTTANWDLVGLLDGSAGFGEQQSLDSTDHSAWGVGVIATTRRNFKLTRTFTALEDNATVLGLIYDASGVTFTDEDYSGTLSVRDSAEKFKVAFELRDGVKVRRFISANYAQIEEVGEVTESEEGIQSRPITVGIYPNAAGELWVTYKGDAA